MFFRSVFSIFAVTLGLLAVGVLANLTACSRSTLPAMDAAKSATEALKAAQPAPADKEIDDARFAALSMAAQQEIAAGHLAGAVVLVGHKGEIVYRKAFGNRVIRPTPAAMTADALFDLASLTKVVATATAIMQLSERGRLDLDSPVAAYWPEFGQNGKQAITLRQLLTHTSGMRAEVKTNKPWSGYQGAMQAIEADRPISAPGSTFLYGDVNFIALGEIVRRVSGLPLDQYCARHVFAPLGMTNTLFKPPVALKSRIAPSDLRWGEVQDPTAYRMGGVAGNAGLFSTADDLAVFVGMLLDGGSAKGRRILSENSVAALHSPHSLAGSSTLRGLGWDLLSPYSKDHTDAFPKGSFGHTGYTGTSIWIDPKSDSFLIILTSRLHPDGKGNARPLRAKASAALASILPLGTPASVSAKPSSEPVMAGSGQADLVEPVKTGIDVLKASGFAALAGKHIGLITNHSGLDRDGRSTIAMLNQAAGVDLRAIFSPEHGLSGKLDQKISSSRDPATGLPIYSLYGSAKRPSAEMLQGLDALVYDIQDVGTRFYTYITTMAYAMEAAASAGLDFYVLDRPNPLNASDVQGPVLEPDLKSFIGYFALPLRYGMTVGELAQLLNTENHIGARLHVIKMQDYRRDDWFDQTGLAWTDPSPNIRSLTQATLYPGVGSVESANLSVGRGTDTPFELVGAPWISSQTLAEYLNRRHIPGVTFAAVTFVPRSDRFQDEPCHGVRLHLTDRNSFDAPQLGIELAAALHRLYPGTFQLDKTLHMIGSRAVIAAIKAGKDPTRIRQSWQPDLDRFLALRAKYLLY